MPDDEIQNPSSGGEVSGRDDSELEYAELEDPEPEDDGTLDAADTLEGDPGDDPLDRGIVPPDRWSAGERYGTTLAEERAGESLDQLLAEEEPDADPFAEDDRQADRAADVERAGHDSGRPLPGDTADPRAGRLVAEDEGAHPDEEPDLVARDVGIDAGAASAEEAAVHVVDEDDAADRSAT